MKKKVIDLEAFKKDYGNPLSFKDLSKKYGMAESSLYKLSRKLGLTKRIHEICIDSQELIALYNRGESLTSLRKRYGCSLLAIRKRLNKLHVRIRPNQTGGYSRENNPKDYDEITKRKIENRYVLGPKGLKRCSSCKNVHPISFFPMKMKGRISGLCKTCSNAKGARIRNDCTKDLKRYCHNLSIQIKHRAAKQHVDFDIDGDYLHQQLVIQDFKCYYTMEFLNFELKSEKKGTAHPDYPSVDKLIPQKGYTKGNVVWCKNLINTIKNRLTKEQFIDLCLLIVKNFRNVNIAE